MEKFSENVVRSESVRHRSESLVGRVRHPIDVVCRLYVSLGRVAGAQPAVFTRYTCRFDQLVGAQNVVGRNRVGRSDPPRNSVVIDAA